MSDVKPGIKTTEFWLTTAVSVCGILMSSGLLGAGTLAAQIIGGGLTIMAALGYTHGRASVKKHSI